MLAAAGVRHRRIHRTGRIAQRLGSAPPGRARQRRSVALRRKGGNRIRYGDAPEAAQAPGADRAVEAGRGGAARERAALGEAATRGGDLVHGMDARWTSSPSRLHRIAGGQIGKRDRGGDAQAGRRRDRGDRSF